MRQPAGKCILPEINGTLALNRESNPHPILSLWERRGTGRMCNVAV